MKHILHLLATSFCTTGLLAQTFNATPNQNIVDNSTSEYNLTVSGLSSSVLDTTTFGLESVCINLTHTWVADLNIYLIAPDGTITSLSVAQGGDGDNYTHTCFDPSSPQVITQGAPPFTGNFAPMGQLGIVNNGQNGNGIWKLRIVDTYPADDGTLINWSLTFGNNPASFFTISSSDLPIFVINTNGQSIPDEPRISANMGVIWHHDTTRNFVSEPFNHYNLHVGIETRGASSGGFAKKSYRIELWDQNGTDIDSSLVGFPIENDWVLSAQYADKTLMRGMLTFDLIRKMGWWAPRTKPVELILNGEYQGVYLLMEKVKRGENRIDIAKLNPSETFGDDLTGGYILKLDKNSGQSSPGWTSPYDPWPSGSSIEINYEYPDAADIVPEQMTYIQSFIDSFETALAGPDFMDPYVGYRNFVDINSCVDAFIIQEYTKSIDAYRKSFFMYKDKDSKNGRLVMAPVWDYDLSLGNVNFCEGENPTGWQYNFNYVCGGDYWLNPFWFERMTQDPYFNMLVRCRWDELKMDVLNNQRVGEWIDSTANVLNESQDWNFTVWPIMGTYVWPNNFVGQNYQEEIDYLKTWIQDRYDFLENNILPYNNCELLASIDENQIHDIKTYPNPFNGFFECSLFKEKSGLISLSITNVLGVNVYKEEVPCEMGNNKLRIEPKESLSSGTYILTISDGSRRWTKKLTVE